MRAPHCGNGPPLSLAILCFAGAAAFGCRLNPCEERNAHEARSPDGSRIARTYQRDCGATTREGTIVEVRRAWSPFWSVVFASDGAEGANLAWTGENALRIRPRVVDASRPVHSEASAQGVNVTVERR